MSNIRKYIPSANSLLIFEAAARLLNFRLASEELRMTQPNVSHAIKALEAHLDIPLFNRGNRGVSLTNAGSRLYATLHPALLQIEETLHSISRQNSKSLTVAASTSLAAQWLLPLCAEYQRSHQDIKVHIITTDRNLDPDGDIDFSIRRMPRDLIRKNCWHIGDEELYTICSPAYLATRAPVREVKDLIDHNIIHNQEPYRDRMSWQEWLSHYSDDHLNIPESLVLHDYQLVLQACLAGEGIALGWSVTSGQLVEQGVLVQPLPQRLKTPFAFYMLASEKTDLSEQKLSFAEWVTDRLHKPINSQISPTIQTNN